MLVLLAMLASTRPRQCTSLACIAGMIARLLCHCSSMSPIAGHSCDDRCDNFGIAKTEFPLNVRFLPPTPQSNRCPLDPRRPRCRPGCRRPPSWQSICRGPVAVDCRWGPRVVNDPMLLCRLVTSGVGLVRSTLLVVVGAAESHRVSRPYY